MVDPVDPDPNKRLLRFLDRVYETPFDPDSYNEVMDRARDYLFEGQDQSEPGQHVTQGLHDPMIGSHSDRLQKLLEMTEPQARASEAVVVRDRLVGMVMSREGVCTGNSNAADLFGVAFPLALSDLPVSEDTQKELRQILALLQRNAPLGTDVGLLELSDGRRFVCRFAQHQKLDAREEGVDVGLALTIVHVDWSDDLLATAQRRFGLSDSEREVLGATLKGLSQAEIADARGRSPETIKSQSKSILSKAGTERMTDLINLMTNIALFSEPAREVTRPPQPMPERTRLMRMADDRQVAVTYAGVPDGLPCLFVSGLFPGPFFNRALHDGFRRRGLRVVAPSRPGFGQSMAAPGRQAFDACVVSDALEICAAHFDRPPLILTNQGGVSHACRIANALGADVPGLFMIGAGIPIDEKRHLRHMNTTVRVGAIGSRYAPNMLKMIIRVTINEYNRKGHVAYLKRYFADSPRDLASLQDPETLEMFRLSLHHMSAQGAEPMLRDGIAAMADWSGDYKALRCPVGWVHGTDDPVMHPDFVQEWAEAHGHGPVTLIKGGAAGMIWTHADQVLQALDTFMGRAGAF